MKIRGKLLLGFGFYVLLAVALGGVSFLELRAVASGLAAVEAADDLTSTMLEVRRYEKNYLLFKDEASSRSLSRYLAELRAGIARAEGAAGPDGAGAFAAMRAEAARYEATFGELARSPGGPTEGDALERLRATARELQTLAEGLSRREREGVDELLRRARRSIRLFPLVILAAVLVGLVVDAQLSRGIAVPVRRLEELTHAIAGGTSRGGSRSRGRTSSPPSAAPSTGCRTGSTTRSRRSSSRTRSCAAAGPVSSRPSASPRSVASRPAWRTRSTTPSRSSTSRPGS